MSRPPDRDLPTTAEIAALTARLRALSTAGAAADPHERARFLADKDALIERVTAADRAPDHTIGSRDEWADYRTYTQEEAAAELIARGVPPDHASGVVERYLDGLSWERGWSPQDQWEIDDDDLNAMLAEPTAEAGPMVAEGDPTAQLGLTGAEGPPIDAGPALTAEAAAHELAAEGHSLDAARALVRGYLDDVSEQIGTSAHLWGLDEADLEAIRASEAARTAEAVKAAHDVVAAHTAPEPDGTRSVAVDERTAEAVDVDEAGL